MHVINKNTDFIFYKMDNSENDHSTEDELSLDIQHPKPQKTTDMFIFNNSKEKKLKICTSVLVLLLLSASVALLTVGILYHNKVASFEMLHEQYENTTATLLMQEHKAKEKEKMYEGLKVKYLELEFACNQNKSEECGEGWKPLGFKCYYFSSEKLDWVGSRNFCAEKGGHLVIITNQVEQNFVASQIGDTYWIGLNDLETEGKWMWVNSQSLNETGVMFWFSAPAGPAEPDNWTKEDPSGENCAALGHEDGYTHKWFDASCRKLKQFICEK